MAYYIDEEVAEQRRTGYKIETDNDQHLARLSNGDKLVLIEYNSLNNVDFEIHCHRYKYLLTGALFESFCSLDGMDTT